MLTLFCAQHPAILRMVFVLWRLFFCELMKENRNVQQAFR